jgi:hypothetical protein
MLVGVHPTKPDVVEWSVPSVDEVESSIAHGDITNYSRFPYSHVSLCYFWLGSLPNKSYSYILLRPPLRHADIQSTNFEWTWAEITARLEIPGKGSATVATLKKVTAAVHLLTAQ